MVAIKGSRSGVVIVFNGSPSEPLAAKLSELETKLVASPGFFRGSEVIVDVRDAAMEAEDLQRIVMLLATHDVRVGGVLTQNERTLQNAQMLGVALQAPKAKASRSEHTPLGETAFTVEETLFIERRIRSGQVLRHPGNIVIHGDVSPGAQIIAGGNIMVWGRLRGSAHAGAMGNQAASISALDLSPTLLKIADVAAWNSRTSAAGSKGRRPWLKGLFATAPELPPSSVEPRVARLVNGEIVIAAWHCR